MNCQEINPRLYLLADGELLDSEMQAVRGHLAGCADCRSLLISIERENDILSEAATVPLWKPEQLRLLENQFFRYIEWPDWAGVAFRKHILAFASALMLILGGAMQLRVDQSVLAHSISRLQMERSCLMDIRFQWRFPKTPSENGR